MHFFILLDLQASLKRGGIVRCVPCVLLETCKMCPNINMYINIMVTEIEIKSPLCFQTLVDFVPHALLVSMSTVSRT